MIDAPTTPTLNWAKDVDGIRYVKALIVSDSADPEPTSLRADVLAKVGSVYFRYLSVTALSVRVVRMSARPNRWSARAVRVGSTTSLPRLPRRRTWLRD